MLAVLLFIVGFIVFFILLIFLVLCTGNSGPQKTYTYYCNDDYDDDDDFYDDDMGYGDTDYDDVMYKKGYKDGFREGRESNTKKEESAWKPLPDYVDDYGYYCPDCDADLFDEHCDHEDDWT